MHAAQCIGVLPLREIASHGLGTAVALIVGDQDAMAFFQGHFCIAAFRLLSPPCIQRPESTSPSMYLAISTSDLSAICNIKASVSVELNGDKREASIND
ncbi:hypothetical protein EYF80_006677 [Liparis tanakae]|uniref:Uncharacterized protein n=1 Tax=Liparis tanakae TaxID=230148 RepID=A0A4Z2IYL2_9TELE|nr:hypothetical protein EYF80_006677 [Liparis tanakae]